MPALNVHRLSVIDRISLAKEKTERVVDHLRASILMHEANTIVVYSPTLADQIPTSRAAHAFNQFQQSMHYFEIVRLCALWDKADRDGESVPTVIELVDDPDVLAALKKEGRTRWSSGRPFFDQAWGAEHAAREFDRLADAIAKAKAVETSPRLASVQNIRHKYLAHSLTSTHLERNGTVLPMKYGDERWLFEETLVIVDGLHLAINGAGFAWDEARRIARRNATALWTACKFNITD